MGLLYSPSFAEVSSHPLSHATLWHRVGWLAHLSFFKPCMRATAAVLKIQVYDCVTFNNEIKPFSGSSVYVYNHGVAVATSQCVLKPLLLV